MKKWQIEKKLFRVFLFPSFQFCPTAKIKNSDLKILENISEISEISEVSEFSKLRDKLYVNNMFKKSFTKSTDQRPTDPPTHRPPTTNPPIHRPTDSIIIFKRLDNRKIFILQNIHAAKKVVSVCYLFDE